MSDNEGTVLLLIRLENALDPKNTKASSLDQMKQANLYVHTHGFAESGPNILQSLTRVHYCTLLGWKFPHKYLDNN